MPWERRYSLDEYYTHVRLLEANRVFEDLDAVDGLIVADENTKAFAQNGPFPVLSLQPGEDRKTWDSVDRILQTAVSKGLGRDSLIVGFGGGVICDMTAFAASVYMRGCRLHLIPTTLLAMVDAAIGGKTGIDYAGLKNMLGSFYPATEVRICPAYLDSLSDREYRSGMAEVIKAGLLDDAGLYETLLKSREAVTARDPDLLPGIIWSAVEVKGRAIEVDLRENGVRAHLNLGHTFGHALEAVMGFGKWTHGEAVCWGIQRAMKAGQLLGVTDSEYAGAVEELLRLYDYTLEAPGIDPDRIIEAMKADKKKRRGKIRLVLQRGLCSTDVFEVEEDLIREALSSQGR